MANQKIVNYIDFNLRRGVPVAQIRQGLRSSGWPDPEIKEAMNYVNQQYYRSGSRSSRSQFPSSSSSPSLSPAISPSQAKVHNLNPKVILMLALIIVMGGVLAFFILTKDRCGENQYFDKGECINYECLADSECGDNNPDTTDICASPATARSRCENELIVCGGCQYLEEGACLDYVCCDGSDCDDGNASTADSCINGTSSGAVCVSEEVVCGDCQYLDNGVCVDYVCCSDVDCDDGNVSTADSCINASTFDAVCVFEETICDDCQYFDNGSCFDYGCCTNRDCNDNDNETNDVCVNRGTLNATCRNIFIGMDECGEDIDCDDGNDATEDSCSGVPKTCSNTLPGECESGDNYCPEACTYYQPGAYPLVFDEDCGIPDQENEALTFSETNNATSDNPHATVLFISFSYDENDNDTHGYKTTSAELDNDDNFTIISSGDNDFLLLYVVEAEDGVQEQVITAYIDGEAIDIFLPEEDPPGEDGHEYYVAVDGSTYYSNYQGTGTFIPPDEAFIEENVAGGG